MIWVKEIYEFHKFWDETLLKYKQYFHNGDRRGIFKLIVDHYGVNSALYPGSYIHIAPSFYIPTTVYVDSYKKTEEFFNDKAIFELISKQRVYKRIPIVRYHKSIIIRILEKNLKILIY